MNGRYVWSGNVNFDFGGSVKSVEASGNVVIDGVIDVVVDVVVGLARSCLSGLEPVLLARCDFGSSVPIPDLGNS